MEVPRRWLRVKRNDAFGELPWRVATCRQTVEVATCRQTVEVATRRQTAVATCRQTAVATCRQTVEALLAPLVHRLAADGYSKRAKGKKVISSDASSP